MSAFHQLQTPTLIGCNLLTNLLNFTAISEALYYSTVLSRRAIYFLNLQNYSGFTRALHQAAKPCILYRNFSQNTKSIKDFLRLPESPLLRHSINPFEGAKYMPMVVKFQSHLVNETRMCTSCCFLGADAASFADVLLAHGRMGMSRYRPPTASASCCLGKIRAQLFGHDRDHDLLAAPQKCEHGNTHFGTPWPSVFFGR